MTVSRVVEPTAADVLAAGAVLWRPAPHGVEIALVHRPRYDDWSFPKGKLDPGELVPSCAIREVREETGLDVRLGVPLSSQRYPLDQRSTGGNGRHKRVHYWAARVVGDDDVAGYLPNDEIDEVRWVPRARARDLLTYAHDRDTLREALSAKKTRTLVVLRHTQAHRREGWHGDDRFRPLLRAGQLQATRLVALLAAYDVTRLVSSSSTRCVETLLPYAGAAGRDIEALAALSEEDATRADVRAVLADAMAGPKRAVVCTHRPVLPHFFDVLGLEDPELSPGETYVVHHRKGRVVATERHEVPPA